ncbi:hypothetical protein Bca4012_057033 [Brassica carinata]
MATKMVVNPVHNLLFSPPPPPKQGKRGRQGQHHSGHRMQHHGTHGMKHQDRFIAPQVPPP